MDRPGHCCAGWDQIDCGLLMAVTKGAVKRLLREPGRGGVRGAELSKAAGKSKGNAPQRRGLHTLYIMLTARPANKATTASEILDCSMTSTLAQRPSTGESVGEKAVLVLKARNR